MGRPFNQIAKELGILVGIVVLGFFILDKTTSIFKVSNPQNIDPGKQVVEVPDIKTPVSSTYSGVGGPEFKELSLYDPNNPYKPEKDVFSNPSRYLGDMVSIGLNGRFLEAEMIIEGEVDNQIQNFLNVSVDYFSGKYGVVGNTCAVDANCSFSSTTPINVTIDLMGKELFSGEKVKLWSRIQPQPNVGAASVAKILVVPFGQDGQPSSIIKNIRIKYLCEVEGCEIAKCPKYPNLSVGAAEYKCALDLFRYQAAKNLSR